MKKITYNEFENVDLRSGTITKVKKFLRVKKSAFKVWVNFGSKIGILQTSAQITNHYDSESLIGKCVVGCINLGEKNIAGFISQFLLVGFYDEKKYISIVTIDPKVPNRQKMC